MANNNPFESNPPEENTTPEHSTNSHTPESPESIPDAYDDGPDTEPIERILEIARAEAMNRPDVTEPDLNLIGDEPRVSNGPPTDRDVPVSEDLLWSGSDDGFDPPAAEDLPAGQPDNSDSAFEHDFDPREMAPPTEVVAVQPHSEIEPDPEPPLPIEPSDALERPTSNLFHGTTLDETPATANKPAEDQEDVTNLPLDSSYIGSGWLDVSAEAPVLPGSEVSTTPHGDDDSDILSDSESRSLLPVASGGEDSSILSDPPGDGSSYFDEPGALTRVEPVDLPDDDSTFADINLAVPPSMPGGEFGDFQSRLAHPSTQDIDLDESDDATMDDQPIPVPLPTPSNGGIDFDRVDYSASGSNLFADAQPQEGFGASGLDLSHPEPDLQRFTSMGGQSSIFVNDMDEATEADFPGLDDPPSELDMDINGPEPSSIFNSTIPGAGAIDLSDIDVLGGHDDMLDPPSELDMGAIPAPPSSIFRPVKDRSRDAWDDSDESDDASIFGQGFDDLTEADFPGMGDDPSELDMDSLPAPPSSIFRPTGTQIPSRSDDPVARGTVSFDIPVDPTRGSNQHAETSGMIDWSVPPEEDDLKKYNLASTGQTGPLHAARAEAGLRTSDLTSKPPEPPVYQPQAEPDMLESWASPEPMLPPEPLPEPVPAPSTRKPKKSKPAAATTERRSSNGLLGGLAVGLLIGVGGSLAAYFAGLVPTDAKSPPTFAANNTIPTEPSLPLTTDTAPKVTVDDAHRFLAAGDPARALAGFEQAGEDAPAEVIAARGQARWLTRIRELAAANQAAAADDAELTKAAAELLAARSDPEAGVQAALHLGLLKELAGQPEAARTIYTEAANEFPEARPIFETALLRLSAVAPAGNQQSSLAPHQAEELARAVLVTLVLLQQPTDAKTETPKEPGFLFWKAVNAANTGDYEAAITAITEARKLHDTLRLQHVGGGVNPTSDPLGQVFLKACDDLRDYWGLRRDLYAHPKIGDLAKTDGVIKAVDTTMTKLEDEKKVLVTDLDKAATKLKDAETMLTKVGTEKDAALKDLTDVKTLLAKSMSDLVAAQAKLSNAEATVAIVLNELKANKLIDDADPAKLPAIIKTVAATAATTDAKKAAEALLKAKKDLETAQDAVKKAEADAAKAAAVAKAATDNVDKLVATAKADLEKKLAEQAVKAAKEAETYLAKLKSAEDARLVEEKKREDAVAAAEAKAARELAAKEAEYRKLLAAQADDFAQKLADVRAGTSVPLSNAERANLDRAAKAYSSGVLAYQASRFVDAEKLFLTATEQNPNDARYWYYLGLSQWAQGKANDSEEAFKKGSELEARNRPATTVVAASLERVQGAARRVLASHRP